MRRLVFSTKLPLAVAAADHTLSILIVVAENAVFGKDSPMTTGTDDNGVGETIRITMMRIARAFLSLKGLLWTVIVIWFFLMAGGLSLLHFAHLGKRTFLVSWWFVGPLFLIAEPLLEAHRPVPLSPTS